MIQDKKAYVRFLRALASEERIAILEELENKGKINASEVEKKFYMEQSTASHHLNILKKANILDCQKQGRNIFYHLKEEVLDSFYRQFLEELRKKQEQKLTAKTPVSLAAETDIS
jgi:ArsR family transcriptional regulator